MSAQIKAADSLGIVHMESTCYIAAAVLPTVTVVAMQQYKDAMKCAVNEMWPQKD